MRGAGQWPLANDMAQPPRRQWPGRGGGGRIQARGGVPAAADRFPTPVGTGSGSTGASQRRPRWTPRPERTLEFSRIGCAGGEAVGPPVLPMEEWGRGRVSAMRLSAGTMRWIAARASSSRSIMSDARDRAGHAAAGLSRPGSVYGSESGGVSEAPGSGRTTSARTAPPWTSEIKRPTHPRFSRSTPAVMRSRPTRMVVMVFTGP